MAELADAYDSGSYVRKDMQVQFLLPAPKYRSAMPDGIFLFKKRIERREARQIPVTRTNTTLL